MAAVALGLWVVLAVLAVGVRVGIHYVRTGSTGLNIISGGATAAEWWAGVLLFAGGLCLGLAPALDLIGVLDPIAVLDVTALQVIGLLLAAGCIVLGFMAQLAMGDSWRIGVEPGEPTELVTGGVFEAIRNPIFAALIVIAIGFVLMVPSVVTIAGFAAIFLAVELQVRAVEEPYLLRTYGPKYRDYAARVGRFVPGIGLLSPRGADA